MADGKRQLVNERSKRFDDGGESFGLRLEDVIAMKKIVARCGADMHAAGFAADVVGAAFEDELLVWLSGVRVSARNKEAELER
jgi:hypothetical protein